MRNKPLFIELFDSNAVGSQQNGDITDYKDIPEYCYSSTKEEVIKKEYSLVPSKYIEKELGYEIEL